MHLIWQTPSHVRGVSLRTVACTGTSCLPYQSEECGSNCTRHETGYRNNVFIKDHLTLERNRGVFCVAKTARNQAIHVHNSDIKDFHRGVWHLWKKKKKKTFIRKVTRGKSEIKSGTNYNNITWSIKWREKKPLEPDRKKCCWRLVNISSRRQTWTMPVSLLCQ